MKKYFVSLFCIAALAQTKSMISQRNLIGLNQKQLIRLL